MNKQVNKQLIKYQLSSVNFCKQTLSNSGVIYRHDLKKHPRPVFSDYTILCYTQWLVTAHSFRTSSANSSQNEFEKLPMATKLSRHEIISGQKFELFVLFYVIGFASQISPFNMSCLFGVQLKHS